MSLTFLTTNRNKFAEAQRFFPDVEMLPLELPEIQELDLQKIIEQKLEYAIAALGESEEKEKKLGLSESCAKVEQFFVEDSALYLKSMNGFPGPLVKWMLQSMGCEGIAWWAMQHHERRATARTMIGYANTIVPPIEVKYFIGEVQGMIVPPRGKNDFGFGPIFLPDHYTKTFGEMTREEKDTTSMRALAFKKMKEYLGEVL